MKNKIIIWTLSFLIAGVIGCKETPPTYPDGQGALSILALGDTSFVDTIKHFAPLKNAKVVLASEYGIMIKYTDNDGFLKLSNLPASVYQITVRQPHPQNPNVLIVGNLMNIPIGMTDKLYSDTVKAEQIPSSGIAINEVYAGGPVNNIYFFYDQFIELYNYSDSVKYLDGIIVMRMSGNNEGKGPGADEEDDDDIDGVTYIFKFPGNHGETNYPIMPKQFITLAQTGINHKNTVAASIDLSKADWEFYNQYSATDFDNPNVKNLLNIQPDKTVDFMINLGSDIIVIADGVYADTTWKAGIKISSIIDGIEYQSSHSTLKTLDHRVDKSYMLSPPKYGGQSMRRREPGVDTNDGLLDWEIIPTPTPGYH